MSGLDLELDFKSTGILWNGFISETDFVFSLDTLRLFSAGSVLLELPDFECSVFDDPSLIKSDLDDPEEPNLINSEDDLELDFDWSILEEPDFDWPDRFAARLASPLRGLAPPCDVDSFRDDVD